jgi:hypothetical protein
MIATLLAAYALIAVQATPPIANSQPEPVINTGAGLLENCTVDAAASGKAERDYHLGLCIGFIKGVTNTLSEQRLGDICPPDDLTNDGLKDVVVTWLQRHPEFLGAPAVGAVVSATTDAFPCEATPSQEPAA